MVEIFAKISWTLRFAMGSAPSSPLANDVGSSNLVSSSSATDISGMRRFGKHGSKIIHGTTLEKSTTRWTEGSWRTQKALCIHDKDTLLGLDAEKPALVLLGRGGVGKSTIAKQIAVKFGKGTNEKNMKKGVEALIRSLVGMMNDVSQELMNVENLSDEVVAMLDDLADNAGHVNWDALGENAKIFKEGLQGLWKEEIVRESAKRLMLAPKTKEIGMMYENAFICTKYLDCIFEENFELHHEEFIKIRDPTNKVEVEMAKHEESEFQLVDVGGQIHLQQEWNSIVRKFKGNCGMIYVVSMADYSHEMNDGNALELSLKTWQSIWQNKILAGIPTILVLNKSDLFKEELQKNPLSICPLFKENEAAVAQKKDESIEQYQKRCHDVVVESFQNVHTEFWPTRAAEMDSCNKIFLHFDCKATDQDVLAEVISKIVSNLNRRDLASFLQFT